MTSNESEVNRLIKKKRIQRLQSIIKQIDPSINLKKLGAGQWNSKNAEAIYRQFIKQNAPSLNTTNKITRSSAFKAAKTLGWEKPWGVSNTTQLLDYINNDAGLSSATWKTAFGRFVDSKTPFTQVQLELLQNKALDSGKKYNLVYTLNNNDTIYTIPFSYKNLDTVLKYLQNYYKADYERETDGSNPVENTLVTGFSSMSIEEVISKDNKRVKKAGAGWANWFNDSTIDLSKYQIYTREQDDEKYETCILHTLKQNGINETVINQIKSIFGEQQIYDIAFKHLPAICNIIERSICVHKYRKDPRSNQVETIMYGKKHGEVINMSVYRDHAFVYEPTIYTSCYVKNIDELALCDDDKKFSCSKVVKGKPRHTNKPSYLTSLALVKLLDNQGHFSAYRSTAPSQAIVKPEPSLDLIDQEQRLFGSNTRKPRPAKEIVILSADFESEVCNGTHKPIMFSCKDINDRTPAKVLRPTTTGADWETLFMKQIARHLGSIVGKYDPKKTEVQMYFHNLKYDFALFAKHFYKTGIVESGGSLYESTICIHAFKRCYFVKCRDSLKFFNCKLSKLPKMFNLPAQKEEAIAYEYYTHQNIQSSEDIPTDEYVKYLPDVDTVQKFREITDNAITFNPTEYYISYLRADVEVLALALLEFGEKIENLTGIKLGEKMTISSIGHQNAVNQGCYEGCYEVYGNLRCFVQGAVKGGRVLANPKHKKKVINGPTEDFDAVSMYPSAMCRMRGVPMGLIKKGTEHTFDYYQSKDYYIVKIHITKINKVCDVPVVTIKEEDGSIRYINDVPEQGLTTTVDKITLEDYIEFADIEYEIVEGVYWDEGFNPKIGETMLHLHNERSKYKKTNPPKAEMIKLLMNSTYGKTIQKLNDKQVTYRKSASMNNYIHENFGQIIEIEQAGDDQMKITSRDYDLSYSLNYVGVYILSTSKRMMNEVFGCMETVNSPMYYTDTDSIHLPQKDIPAIAEIYNERYGKELIGKNLGQFHTDFSMSGCRDVYSVKSVFLGSKVYIDVLQGVDEKTGEVKQDVHMRMKGVNSAGIEHEIAKINPDPSKRIETAFSIYEKLCDSDYSHEFCLNPTKSNVSFDHTNSGIITRETGSFTRVVSF